MSNTENKAGRHGRITDSKGRRATGRGGVVATIEKPDAAKCVMSRRQLYRQRCGFVRSRVRALRPKPGSLLIHDGHRRRSVREKGWDA